MFLTIEQLLMRFLELKIPPVVIVFLSGLAMWGASNFAPMLDFSFSWSIYLALACLVAGVTICFAGVREFIKAQTTVNPRQPNNASRIVTSGIYRFSRNPMYLGFFFILSGWAIYLSNGLAVAILFGYVAYMNQFQIIPEEKALTAKFGAGFKSYKESVRRWL